MLSTPASMVIFLLWELPVLDISRVPAPVLVNSPPPEPLMIPLKVSVLPLATSRMTRSLPVS